MKNAIVILSILFLAGCKTLGERIFAFVHTKKGNRFSFSEGLSEWGHAQQVMDFWAKKVVERLDEIKATRRW